MDMKLNQADKAMLETSAKVGAAVGLGLASLAANAQSTGVDYSSLTTAVDWTSVGTALLAVGGAVIAIAVVFKGIKLVIRMVRGG